MLTGLVILLLALIVILAIPVSFTYRVYWRRAFQGSIKLRWLFGMVRVQLPLSRSNTPAPAVTDSKRKTRNKKSSRHKNNPVAAIRQKAFRQRIMKFIRDFWHAIHKQNITLHIRIGLGDPAETGQLWAIVGPVSGYLATLQDATIDIEPEFIDPVFELNSSGSIHIVPLKMIYLTIGLLLSPAIWKGVNRMRKAG